MNLLVPLRKSYTLVGLTALLLTLTACGGGSGSSSAAVAVGPLAGNWQFFLVQEEPRPQVSFGASGFLQQTDTALTGNVAFPATQNTSNPNCGGVALMSGTANGTAVQLSFDVGGTALTFTGILAGDNKSMSGSYQGSGGGCFMHATSGTWTAIQIPALNGSFTGTLTNSPYMEAVTGVSPSAPITLSGNFVQTSGIGSSNASVTGTIDAVGYPCFASVSVSGTISGQNATLTFYKYDGSVIGFTAPTGTTPGPAVVSSGSNGVNLSGILAIGFSSSTVHVGACPPVTTTGSTPRDSDAPQASFAIQN